MGSQQIGPHGAENRAWRAWVFPKNFLFDTYPGFPWPCWNRSWWKSPLALMTNGLREPFLWDEESSLKSFRIYKIAPSFWEQSLGCFPVSECLKRQQLNWSLDYKFCVFRFLFIRVGYLLIFCLILGIAKIFWTFKTLRASVFKTLENPLDSFLGCPGVAVFGSLSWPLWQPLRLHLRQLQATWTVLPQEIMDVCAKFQC